MVADTTSRRTAMIDQLPTSRVEGPPPRIKCLHSGRSLGSKRCPKVTASHIEPQIHASQSIGLELASLLVKGYGFGLIGNIVVGITGAINAGWMLPHIGIVLLPGVRLSIVDSVVGAVILLLVIRLY